MVLLIWHETRNQKSPDLSVKPKFTPPFKIWLCGPALVTTAYPSPISLAAKSRPAAATKDPVAERAT